MDAQNAVSLSVNETYLGQTAEVLVEGASKSDPAVWTGRTDTGKIVLWPHQNEKIGELAQVIVEKCQTWVLKGRLK